MPKSKRRHIAKNNRKEAYAYVRVSIADENPENQIMAIERWAKAHRYEIVKVFQEVKSGGIPPWQRPVFQELLEHVKKDPRPILVYELSRLGRTFYETFRAIKELEDLGAPVIPVSEKEKFLQNLDPSIRELIIALFAWVAERERELLRERTKEGMARAKAQGKHVGRPPIPIDMKKVKEYREKGLSYRDIARLLGVNYYTLLRRVKNSGG